MAHNIEKHRGVLRIILGNTQMFAAVVALILLWRLGVCPVSIIAAAAAGALLLTSIVLFRVVRAAVAERIRATFDKTSPGNETQNLMLRRAFQLLLCLSLILVSGPLAPCKLEHALMKFSVRWNPSRSIVKAAGPTWRGTQDQDDNCAGDGSCWCSLHMSAQDAAGTTLPDVPTAFAILNPITTDLFPVRAEASRPVSYALEPPISISARSLPLLI